MIFNVFLIVASLLPVACSKSPEGSDKEPQTHWSQPAEDAEAGQTNSFPHYQREYDDQLEDGSAPQFVLTLLVLAVVAKKYKSQSRVTNENVIGRSQTDLLDLFYQSALPDQLGWPDSAPETACNRYRECTVVRTTPVFTGEGGEEHHYESIEEEGCLPYRDAGGYVCVYQKSNDE